MFCRFDISCLFFSKFSVWFKLRNMKIFVFHYRQTHVETTNVFFVFRTQTNICVFYRQNICNVRYRLVYLIFASYTLYSALKFVGHFITYKNSLKFEKTLWKCGPAHEWTWFVPSLSRLHWKHSSWSQRRCAKPNRNPLDPWGNDWRELGVRSWCSNSP